MLKFLVVALMALFLTAKPKENILYPDVGLITEISGDTVKILMQNGNVFEFTAEDGDWFEGDLAAVIMDNNGTEEIEDDKIIQVKYSGWITDEEVKTWVK